MDGIRGRVVFILALLLWVHAAGAEHVTMSTIEAPPLYSARVMPGGKHGVAIDLAVAAWKAEGVDVSFEFVPMSRAVWSVIERKHMAMLGTPEWFSKENKDSLIETVDLLMIHFLFFYKKDRFPGGITYDALSDLKKYKIGSTIGSAALPPLQAAGLDLELVGEIDLNFKKLKAGHVDLATTVDVVGWSILQILYPDALQEFATIGKPYFSGRISVIFLKDQATLIVKFKEGLEKILRNGTYRRIVEEYYGRDDALKDVLPESLHDRISEGH